MANLSTLPKSWLRFQSLHLPQPTRTVSPVILSPTTNNNSSLVSLDDFIDTTVVNIDAVEENLEVFINVVASATAEEDTTIYLFLFYC